MRLMPRAVTLDFFNCVGYFDTGTLIVRLILMLHTVTVVSTLLFAVHLVRDVEPIRCAQTLVKPRQYST